MPRSRIHQMERVLGFAARFVEEVRDDLGRAKMDGSDTPPRVRCVHERPGHASPEFRTLSIPVPEGLGGVSPEILSGVIARYAATKKPDCLLLVFEAETEENGPVLIAEARCRYGTRMFWVQPYRMEPTHVEWSDPLDGGWRDPGDEEMILDAAFPLAPPAMPVIPTRPIVVAKPTAATV